MEYLLEIFNLYSFSYALLLMNPYIYPYVVKGDIPYKDEENPDAAVIVAGVEGILLSAGVGAILSVLWFKIYNMPLEIGAFCVSGIVIVSLGFHIQDRVEYGKRVTWLDVTNQARKRYSWILGKTDK